VALLPDDPLDRIPDLVIHVMLARECDRLLARIETQPHLSLGVGRADPAHQGIMAPGGPRLELDYPSLGIAAARLHGRLGGSKYACLDAFHRVRCRQLVGAPGFEPGTSCSQSRRATSLRYAPPPQT